MDAHGHRWIKRRSACAIKRDASGVAGMATSWWWIRYNMVTLLWVRRWRRVCHWSWLSIKVTLCLRRKSAVTNLAALLCTISNWLVNELSSIIVSLNNNLPSQWDLLWGSNEQRCQNEYILHQSSSHVWRECVRYVRGMISLKVHLLCCGIDLRDWICKHCVPWASRTQPDCKRRCTVWSSFVKVTGANKEKSFASLRGRNAK